MLHLDVMDGFFVPNITFGPVVIRDIRKNTELYLQTHLMIERPERYIKNFKEAGCDSVIIHQEACCDFIGTIKKIKKLNMEAGIALRPKTPIRTIKDVVSQLDMVLLMTVEPGFSGQLFIKGAENKIMQTKKLLGEEGLDIPIGVDGGINIYTACRVVKAGAKYLIAGSSVFNGNPIENINSLYKSIGLCH